MTEKLNVPFSKAVNVRYCSLISGLYLTCHPAGTPETPVTSHVAAAFLTNVPVLDTPSTQLVVYEDPGVAVNRALM